MRNVCGGLVARTKFYLPRFDKIDVRKMRINSQPPCNDIEISGRDDSVKCDGAILDCRNPRFCEYQRAMNSSV